MQYFIAANSWRGKLPGGFQCRLANLAEGPDRQIIGAGGDRHTKIGDTVDLGNQRTQQAGRCSPVHRVAGNLCTHLRVIDRLMDRLKLYHLAAYLQGSGLHPGLPAQLAIQHGGFKIQDRGAIGVEAVLPFSLAPGITVLQEGLQGGAVGFLEDIAGIALHLVMVGKLLRAR